MRGAPVSGIKVEVASPKSGTDLADDRQARHLSSIASAKCPSISNRDGHAVHRLTVSAKDGALVRQVVLILFVPVLPTTSCPF